MSRGRRKGFLLGGNHIIVDKRGSDGFPFFDLMRKILSGFAVCDIIIKTFQFSSNEQAHARGICESPYA